jgi:hypothetical protein
MCFAQPIKKEKFGNAVIDIDTTRLWNTISVLSQAIPSIQ